MKERAVVFWSGGKDSALALHHLEKVGGFEVVSLVTTMTRGYDRVNIHGVRHRLIVRQAASLGLPLEEVYISKAASLGEYESKTTEALRRYRAEGVSAAVAGDIFLEDVRRYREGLLSKVGLRGVYPLWGRNTRELAAEFIGAGFRAIITCVDSRVLDRGFSGRVFDRLFVSDLPPGVDPCGENGEFHSFVFDGPPFRRRISFEVGEVVLREDRFYYCDLIPIYGNDGKASL